jgi:hypothetical protein
VFAKGKGEQICLFYNCRASNGCTDGYIYLLNCNKFGYTEKAGGCNNVKGQLLSALAFYINPVLCPVFICMIGFLRMHYLGAKKAQRLFLCPVLLRPHPHPSSKTLSYI